MTEIVKAEHTALPWFVPDISWEPWEGAIEVRSNNDMDVICYTTSGHGREKADARLIVTAVNIYPAVIDLAKALKDALRSSRKDFKAGPDGDRQHREAYAEQFAALTRFRELQGGE